MRAFAILALIAAPSLASAAGKQGANAPAPDPWAGAGFLVGEWVGEGSGSPGQGSGGFSFRFDLDGHVLLRRDHSEYPATQGRPAIVHDALMVVYPGGDGKGLEAVYFDNEGHVIRYAVSAAPGSGVVFLSAADPASPRYRLTYLPLGADEVTVTFEIAPPGEPPAFKTYLSGRSRRVSPK